MECIFNELSAQPVGTLNDACLMMQHFVKSVVAAKSVGIDRIRIPEELGQNLFSLVLAPDYLVGSWLNDERINRDLRDRFRLIVANPPLLNIGEVEALSMFEQSVFCLTEPAGTPEAKGFGVAYLRNTLLVSFLSDPQWDTHTLSGWHWYIDKAAQEQIEQVSVNHFATVIHFEHHKPWIQQQQEEQVQRSSDIWERRTVFFPHLTLCGDVKRQLSNVGMSGHLNQIIDRLRALDAFAEKWNNGNFDLNRLNAETNLRVSGESSSTLSQYSGQRRFKLPDGRRALFDLHIKIGDLRFHFYPDDAVRKVYVGYIGGHLSTVSG